MASNVGPVFGTLRRGTVIEYRSGDQTMLVNLDLEGQPSDSKQNYLVPVPLAASGPNGEILGFMPKKGSPVILGQGMGGEWYVVSYIPVDNVFSDTTSLAEGRILLQVRDNIGLFVDPTSGVNIGSQDAFVQIDPDREIFSHCFDSELFFTEATRSVRGVVKRDLRPNPNRGVTGSALSDHGYDDGLSKVGMDSSGLTDVFTDGSNTVRNLPLVENRELTYEFAHSGRFSTDEGEAELYANSRKPGRRRASTNRKELRTDTLSLGLTYPNHLLEIVKGTVVDIFGNVLDLNRTKLPLGTVPELSIRTAAEREKAFAKIRAQLRKSLAYHFEINTRKDTASSIDAPAPVPDVTSVADYGRNRSRFFFDVDKEGQFKLNVPSSSERGNVPLLARYENHSTLLSAKLNTDPNAFSRNTDHQDVYLDGFALTGTPDAEDGVKLSGSDSSLEGFEAPVDRVTGKPIKLNTAYHNISTTVESHQTENQAAYDPDNQINDTTVTPVLEKIVSDNIVVSGEEANAGGRSGTMNFDGFISLSVGANTVDRQSLWFDYAGGVVGRVGRDLRGVSYAVSLDGDLLMQVGGTTVANDSRFTGPNGPSNALRSGAVDIRVMTATGDPEFTIVRIDEKGIKIITPGRLDISAQQSIRIKSGAKLIFDAEEIIMYGNEIPGVARPVLRKPNQSIG